MPNEYNSELSPSKDIVERLRKNCACNFDSTPCGAEEECRNAFEAADEIERLREQVEIERASLRAAFEELRTLDKQIEWLRKELQGQALGEKE